MTVVCSSLTGLVGNYNGILYCIVLHYVVVLENIATKRQSNVFHFPNPFLGNPTRCTTAEQQDCYSLGRTKQESRTAVLRDCCCDGDELLLARTNKAGEQNSSTAGLLL